jgi:hypothetical protein
MKKRKTRDVSPSDADDIQVDEAEELEEDIRLAEEIAPFFCKFVVSCMLRQLTLSSPLKSLTCEVTGTLQ